MEAHPWKELHRPAGLEDMAFAVAYSVVGTLNLAGRKVVEGSKEGTPGWVDSPAGTVEDSTGNCCKALQDTSVVEGNCAEGGVGRSSWVEC